MTHFEPATSSAFVRSIISWRQATSDAPAEHAEALAVVLLAVIAGPRLYLRIRQEPQPVFPNLYVLCTGPSTTSHKSNTKAWASRVVAEVAPEAVMELPGSSEAFVQDLADHESGGGFLNVDEAAWWLDDLRKKKFLSNVRGDLLRAYDGERVGRRNRTKWFKADGGPVRVGDKDSVEHPCLTVLGFSTPEKLASVLTHADVLDGTLPRIAVAAAKSEREYMALMPPDDGADTATAEVVDLYKRADSRVAHGVEAILTQEAWQLADAYQRQLVARVAEDAEHDAMYGRGELRLFKVAQLLALADDLSGNGAVKVEAVHVRDAARLCERWLADAIELADAAGANEIEAYIERGVAYLKKNGGEAPKRDVSKRLKLASYGGSINMSVLEETMRMREVIDVAEVETGGRPSIVWRLSDDAL